MIQLQAIALSEEQDLEFGKRRSFLTLRCPSGLQLRVEISATEAEHIQTSAATTPPAVRGEEGFNNYVKMAYPGLAEPTPPEPEAQPEEPEAVMMTWAEADENVLPALMKKALVMVGAPPVMEVNALVQLCTDISARFTAEQWQALANEELPPVAEEPEEPTYPEPPPARPPLNTPQFQNGMVVQRSKPAKTVQKGENGLPVVPKRQAAPPQQPKKAAPQVETDEYGVGQM